MYEDAQPLASCIYRTTVGTCWYRTYGTYGTEVGTMVPWYLPRERNLQRYQLWYVLGSDELGAVSAQCRVGIKEIKRETSGSILGYRSLASGTD